MTRTARRLAVAVVTVGLLSVPLAAAANHVFGDVDHGYTHAPGIEYVADTGITAGCGDGSDYCPNDAVTRGQMATFLHRSSGNAGGIAPSVNAAELGGEGPSAYTTTVHPATIAGGSLTTNTSSGTAALTGTIAALPAGEYVLSGQVHAQGGASSRLVCRTLVGGTQVARAISTVGSNAGAVSQLALPISGHVQVAADGTSLELRCHAEAVAAGAPTISASDLTRLLATRVGDAS